MDIEIQQVEPFSIKIIATAPGEAVQERFDAMMKTLASEAEMPGFRKGKVPKDVLQNKFGDRIAEELGQEMLKEAYHQAAEEGDFVPMLQPRVESAPKLNPEEGFSAEILVEVKPPVELREYKGIPLNRSVEAVTDEEIDGAIMDLRKRAGDMIPVEERPAEEGDFAFVDFKPEGEEEGKKRYLEVTSEATTVLKGREPGESFEGHFEFPPNWPDQELAGNIYDAEVTVHELKEIEPAEMGEKFFSQLGDEIENEEALREAIREDIYNSRLNAADQELRKKAREELTLRNPLELSPMVIDAAVRDVVGRYWDPEKLSEEQAEEIAKGVRPDVIKTITADLLMDKIAEKEDIEVEEDELKQHIAAAAKSNNMEPDELFRHLKQQNRIGSVKADIRSGKVMDFIIENAEITEE